jgi:uncharacterized membrane protein YeaQ/YmgE (transglycosylase-associated protein family)
MSIMGLIAFLILGLVAGLIARAIMPGEQRMGLGMTTVLGVVGSVVGGFVWSLFFSRGTSAGFEPSGLIGSVIGAIVVLFAWGALSRRGHAVLAAALGYALRGRSRAERAPERLDVPKLGRLCADGNAYHTLSA